MLHHRLTSLVLFAAIACALPYSFVLDVGNVGYGFVDAPPSLLPQSTTTEALRPVTTAQTTFSISSVPVPSFTSVSDTTSITHGDATITSCPSTNTTIVTPLPNPTPDPNIEPSRGENEISSTNSDGEQYNRFVQGDHFDLNDPSAVARWPRWFAAATFTLLFYDIITFGALLWLWVFGYFWWFGRSNRGARERRVAVFSGSMGMVRAERQVRNSWYGRARSDSWERERNAREVELEREMRRLGFI
jgi:hypothetical protein